MICRPQIYTDFTLVVFQLQEPVTGTGNKKISFMCFLSSCISLFAETDKREYKPGETILLSGTLDNHSSAPIHQLSLTLVQRALYANSASKYPYGESQRTLVEETFDICCNKSSRVAFSNKPVVIPRSCPPSGLPGCGIIDIEYFVCIEAEASVRLAVDVSSNGRNAMEHDSNTNQLTRVETHQSEESLVLTDSPYMALLGNECCFNYSCIPHMVLSGECHQCQRIKTSDEDMKTRTPSASEEEGTTNPSDTPQSSVEEDPDAHASDDDSPLIQDTSMEDISLQTSPIHANHQQYMGFEIISLPVEDSDSPTSSPDIAASDHTNPRSSFLRRRASSRKQGISIQSLRSSVTFSIPGRCLISQPIRNPHRRSHILTRQMSDNTHSRPSSSKATTCEAAVADLQNIQNEHSHTLMSVDKAFASLGMHASPCQVP